MLLDILHMRIYVNVHTCLCEECRHKFVDFEKIRIKTGYALQL